MFEDVSLPLIVSLKLKEERTMARQMVSRRDFLRFSAITAAGALAAACTPMAPPAAGPAAAPVQKVSIVYWNYMTDMEQIESGILDAFNSSSADLTVKYEFVPWQQYWEKLNATLAAGNPPDVWNTAPTFFFEYILRKQLADLTDLIKQNLDFTDFYETALSGYDLVGKYYGVPRNIVTTVIFFNKDLFNEAGVEPPPLDGNWTWDDFLAKAKAVAKDTDGDGKMDVWGTEALQSSWWLDEMIMGNGGEIFKGEFRRDLVGMTANYDSPEACGTYKFFADLINTHKVAYPAGEFEGMGEPFMTGRLGMRFSLNWLALQAKEAPFDWDLTTVPKGTVDQLTYGGADGLVVSQATKDLSSCWKLIEWLIDPKTGEAFLKQSGAMPVTRSYAESDAYLGTFPGKNLRAFLKSAEIARNTFTLGFSQWKKVLQDELDQAFLGQKPVEQMCVDANKAVNAAIERIRTSFAEALGQ